MVAQLSINDHFQHGIIDFHSNVKRIYLQFGVVLNFYISKEIT